MNVPLNVKVVQVAFFLGSIDLADRLKVAEIVRKSLGDILDGTPTILPVPDDAPLEIPRIILPSKDGKIICNISANRFDFIYQIQEQSEGIGLSEAEKLLEGITPKLNEILFTGLKATSYRLGLIINYSYSSKEGGLVLMKTNILGDENDVANELQLHKMLKGEINAIKVNNWTRLIAIEEQPLVIVSDVNTSQSERYEINPKSSISFFEKAFEVSQKTVQAMLAKKI